MTVHLRCAIHISAVNCHEFAFHLLSLIDLITSPCLGGVVFTKHNEGTWKFYSDLNFSMIVENDRFPQIFGDENKNGPYGHTPSILRILRVAIVYSLSLDWYDFQ